MVFLTLREAVGEILQAYEDVSSANSPFFFMIGAGVSAPAIPVASKIVAECREIVKKRCGHGDTEPKVGFDEYTHWLGKAYAHSKQRTAYLKKLIEGKRISQANFRLAHLLLGEDSDKPKIANMVVTTNFDDHLSRALGLFGKGHVVCDHSATTQRIDEHDANNLYLVHVHGSYHFYDCKNLDAEITQAAQSSSQTTGTMAALLDRVLSASSPLVVGYSGWEQDVFMKALQRRLKEVLPFNLYWFCYRRGSVDSLPGWLKDHQSVRFVVPEESPVKHADSGIGRDAPNLVSAGMSGLSVGFSAEYKEPVLEARTVFEEFNRALGLSAPELTHDPLQFLIRKLHETFPEEDVDGNDDLYQLKSVIERIEQARKPCEERASANASPEPTLEPIRNAIRGAVYEKALLLAGQLDLEQLPSTSLSELATTAGEIAKQILNTDESKLSSALQAIELKIRSYQLFEGREPLEDIRDKIADSLFLKGLLFAEMGKNDEEIAVYDEVVQRYGDAPEAGLREQVAKALYNKGATLGQQGKNDEEIAVYDRVVQRYGDAPEAGLREQVAKALYNKGATLGQQGKKDEAIAVYDSVVQRYGNAPEAGLREKVAKALVNKGVTLGQQGKNDEEIAVYDSVVQRYGDASEAGLREQVANALVYKGVTLSQQGKNDEEIAVYDSVVQRYGDAPEAGLREQVAKALVNKGFRLGQQGKHDEAIAVYDSVVQRYGDAPEAGLREQVAGALVNKGVALGQQGKNDEEIAVYDEVVKRYGEAPEAGLREQVAKALYNKGATLGQQGKKDEAIAVYDSVVQRYGDAPEAGLREPVAKALVNKGVALGQQGKNDEEIAVYDSVVQRYGDAPEAGLREQVVVALNGKGFTLLCEAKKIWRGGNEPSAKSLLAQALVDVEGALGRKPDLPMALGNQGYILFLQGKTEQAREILTKAIQLGGDELRQGELADADIHPLPQDEAFKQLINSL